MKNFNAKKISLLSLLIALIYVATAFIAFPNGFGGYLNLGDAFIIFTALNFNPFFAFVAGGLASALADITLGYTAYAPFTFIIKGLEGLICSYLARKHFINVKITVVISSTISAILMALGYYLTNAFLYDSFTTALYSLPFDLLQGLFGLLVGLSLTFTVTKIKAVNSYFDNAVTRYNYNPKSIVVFNDLSAFGGCSLVANISILTALGHTVHPIPTAVLSHQTSYGDYYMQDGYSTTKAIIEKLTQKKEQVDEVYSGFLGSSELLTDIINFAKISGAKLIIDPVLADDGKLYDCFTNDNVELYKKALSFAYAITPNLTEACYLTDYSYDEIINITNKIEFFEKVSLIAKKLHGFGVNKVIITGVYFDKYLYTIFYNGDKLKIFKQKRLQGSFSGTGDLFSSLYLGYFAKGYADTVAIKKSLDFISKAIKHSRNNGGYNPQGIEFSKIMKNLF